MRLRSIKTMICILKLNPKRFYIILVLIKTFSLNAKWKQQSFTKKKKSGSSNQEEPLFGGPKNRKMEPRNIICT